VTTEKGTIDQLLDFLQLDIKLTEKQRGALDALDWLYGPDVRSGRTTVIALRSIKAAMDNPGTRIVFHDHYSGPSGNGCLVHTVSSLLRELRPEVRGRFTTNRHGITFGRHSAPPRVDITYNIREGRPPRGGAVVYGRRGKYLEEELLPAHGRCELFPLAADSED
jgi:hypothetical protein